MALDPAAEWNSYCDTYGNKTQQGLRDYIHTSHAELFHGILFDIPAKGISYFKGPTKDIPDWAWIATAGSTVLDRFSADGGISSQEPGWQNITRDSIIETMKRGVAADKPSVDEYIARLLLAAYEPTDPIIISMLMQAAKSNLTTQLELLNEFLPAERVVVKEVPVEKIVEKIVPKEVPVEKIVTKEVIKEVPVEKSNTPYIIALAAALILCIIGFIL